MRKFFVPLISALLLLVATPSAQAAAMLDLFDGATITVGDKLFDDWTLFGQTDPFFGSPIDLSEIKVTGINDDPLNPGILFTANNQLTVTGIDFLDLNFGFSVTVLNPQFKIKDNSLEIAEFSIIGDGGLILIEEEIFDENGNSISFKDAFVDNLFLDEKLFDSAEFGPLDKIFVEKNILIAGDFDGDIIEFISFEQHFSQTSVPEPSTLLLLSLGMVGVGFARRRAA